MMRWLLVLGVVWGFWVRDGGEWSGRSAAEPAGDVQTMDGGDPFPPDVAEPGVRTMDGGDPFPPD